jgi:hypothetical protein
MAINLIKPNLLKLLINFLFVVYIRKVSLFYT